VEPILSRELSSFGPIAFRVAVPEIYTEHDPVTLRIFLWREWMESIGCTTLRLDIFRMFEGSGISRYGSPVWLRLEPGSMTSPGMMVLDLPLNTPAPGGLGFSDDLFAPRCWRSRSASSDGDPAYPGDLDADYTILGAELFESASASDTAISG